MDNQQPVPAPVSQPLYKVPTPSPKSKNSHLLPACIVALAILLAGGAISFTAVSQSKDQQKKLDQMIAAQQKPAYSELVSSYKKDLKTDEYQAVFLTGGQVYFGKITKIDSAFITLTDIYYLRSGGDPQATSTTKTAASSDVSLAKLGEELHGPEDQMDIRTGSVDFIENLKPDGQVSQAIAAFKKNK